MNNTKAIVFDAYGTLFDVNSASEKCKDKIGDKWETFANYWRTTQLEYTWLRSLMTVSYTHLTLPTIRTV